MNIFVQLASSIKKELLLIFRDRSGLVLLFIMPSLLVVIMTLLQENVLKSEIDFYLCDQDKGELVDIFSKNISLAANIKLHDFECETKESFQEQLGVMRSHFALFIPEHSSELLENETRKKARADVNLALGLTNDNSSEPSVEVNPRLKLFFDPIVNDSLRLSIQTVAQQSIAEFQIKLRLEEIFSELGKQMGSKMNMPSLADSINFDHLTKTQDVTESTLTEEFISSAGFTSKPSPVQQNVSAWTIFGIFFIVVPIAGAMVQERQSGTMFRLRTTPANPMVFVFGKLFSYVLVCFIQAAFIYLLTTNVLPMLGGQAFTVSSEQLPLVCTMLLFVTLAAVGYGTLLGTCLKTYEQVSVTGPVSIVIAAALGGVMVPVYIMPEIMQNISCLSPLSWALNGFYDIFLRGGGLISVLPELTQLFSFFIFTIILSLLLPKIGHH
ncbi:MAG: ABC transporter permease [Desulfotalea sp.]